jgi:hypothetical protein
VPFLGDRATEPAGGANRESGPRQTVAVFPDTSISGVPTNAPASDADSRDIALGLPPQREQMELACGSGQERGLGQAATIVSGIAALASPVCTPSLAADPTDVNLGIPHRETDAAHPEPDTIRVLRAGLFQ